MAAFHAFGPFRLDTKAEILFKGAEPVPLGRRAVALLRALVVQPGVPLSKDALIEVAWPGLAVEESNLTVQIAAVRRVLGEQPGGERWIETLPRRGYRFVGPHVQQDVGHPPAAQNETAPLALPDKPSIAVLPFQNMSGDPEQEYFADGMVEEIITALSRNKQLFVIARNSSFAYKGKSPDIRQVGRELGVRYVLEGSIRKSANHVRITGQLIEASTGTHIWADRFDGDLDDIFELQDQLTSSVIGGIAPSLEIAEMERAKRKTGNLQAYDHYLRSLAAMYRFTEADSVEGLTFARRAVALDPDFALGHAMIAIVINTRRAFGWVVDPAREREEAEHAVRRALDLDSQDARVLAFCGQTLVVVLGRAEEAAAHLAEAVKIDPNYALGWMYRGRARMALGDPEAAIGDLERALRLSPIDMLKWYPLQLMARAHILCDRYEEARPFVEAALRLRPNNWSALVEKVVANVLAGHPDASREALATFQKIQPEIRASTYRHNGLPPAGLLKYQEALRLAGLPE
jgi:TolB-like protein/Flp pilus assembly protein TadD